MPQKKYGRRPLALIYVGPIYSLSSLIIYHAFLFIGLCQIFFIVNVYTIGLTHQRLLIIRSAYALNKCKLSHR